MNPLTLNIKNFIRTANPEIFLWLFALILLAVLPVNTSSHFTICPAANLGIDWCPGCGLGSSISLFFRGDLINSFNTHPLGIPAVIILSGRVITLLKDSIIRI